MTKREHEPRKNNSGIMTAGVNVAFCSEIACFFARLGKQIITSVLCYLIWLAISKATCKTNSSFCYIFHFFLVVPSFLALFSAVLCIKHDLLIRYFLEVKHWSAKSAAESLISQSNGNFATGMTPQFKAWTKASCQNFCMMRTWVFSVTLHYQYRHLRVCICTTVFAKRNIAKPLTVTGVNRFAIYNLIFVTQARKVVN